MPLRLLLIDDEPALRRLMQLYLQKLGYEVESFDSATTALAAFEASPERADILIVDLMLPDGAGDKLGEKMARLNPALLVLICSGYPFEVAAVPEDIRGRFSALQKPFVPNMLMKSMQELQERQTAG